MKLNGLKLNKDRQYILMTHVGPNISGTTISYDDGIGSGSIQSGSQALSEYILNSEKG